MPVSEETNARRARLLQEKEAALIQYGMNQVNAFHAHKLQQQMAETRQQAAEEEVRRLEQGRAHGIEWRVRRTPGATWRGNP